MFCTNCGAQIADDSQFCTQCGTSFQQQGASSAPSQSTFASTTMVMPTASAAPLSQAAQPEQHKAHKGRGFLIVLVVIALLALIGAIILVIANPFGVGANKASTTDQTSSNTTSTEQAPSKSESTDKADNNAASKGLTAAEQSSSTASSAETVPDSTPGSASASNSGSASGAVSDRPAPFYGVWIGAFSSRDEAERFWAEARSKGFNANVTESDLWTNLNQTHYWVVYAEAAQTKEAAERQLTAVKSAGYSDAYVKYTGTFKG